MRGRAQSLYGSQWLLYAALFAFLWLTARASIQSVTIDEADTYLAYAGPTAPTHWSGSANNQLLNSLLMRLFTTIFGLSQFTIRIPALIGAAIYIYAAHRLVRHISEDLFVQLPLFVCLVFNPFVMDHLVAARGYSLALAFLMLAFAFCDRCRVASISAGLSFTANFSFALVAGAAMLFVFAGACRSGARPLRTLLHCVAPGAAIALFLSGSVLANWPRGQFVYGAYTWGETFHGILEASLYEPNPFLVNPPLCRLLAKGTVWVLPLLGAVCIWRLVTAIRTADPRIQWAGALAGIAVLTVVTHSILFRAAHVLLPKDRTAIYFVPIVFLAAGVLAAIPGGISRRALAGALALTATYFVLCLRLTYFKEWKYDSDAKAVYSLLSYYNHHRGVTDVVLNWRYTAVLNFYRAESGRETLPPFVSSAPPYPAGHQAYVMFYPDNWTFLRDNGLKIVYHAPESDAVVAIDPRIDCAAAPGLRTALIR
jgi:hypothetical protein